MPDILAFPFRAVPFTTDPFPLGNDVRVIAPFWTNIGPGGSIVFAAIDDTTLLQKANSYVNDAYPCQADFSATVILIATYTKVVAAGGTQVQHALHVKKICSTEDKCDPVWENWAYHLISKSIEKCQF